MKLIHLNVESFKYFDVLVDFLMIEKPDILTLVEATNGNIFGDGKQRNFIQELEERFGWNFVFHPTISRDMGTHQVEFGAAVLSRFPISIKEKMYFGGDEISRFSQDYILFSDRPKYERYPYSWKMSMPFLATDIHTDEGILQLLTAHFHVSYECFETLQIWQEAEQVAAYVDTLDTTPLIFAGDLNIRNESMTVKTLAEKMTQQSGDFINTLTPSIHPIFRLNPHDPLRGIDHVFTRDVIVEKSEVIDVVVSDHLPLILNFNI